MTPEAKKVIDRKLRISKYMRKYYQEHPEYQEDTKRRARERYARLKAERLKK